MRGQRQAKDYLLYALAQRGLMRASATRSVMGHNAVTQMGLPSRLAQREPRGAATAALLWLDIAINRIQAYSTLLIELKRGFIILLKINV